MDRLEMATALRHYGLEAIKLAADLEADIKRNADFELPIYWPRFEVEDGVEAVTHRLACCGAGPDRLDERTGQRLHLPGCRNVAAVGIASCRDALNGTA